MNKEVMSPSVKAFFDEATNTVSYVVADPSTGQCAVIDPVLDFDHASGRTSTESADIILAYIKRENMDLAWILETHVHADHLSAARHIKSSAGGVTAIGRYVTDVQAVFKDIFNLGDGFNTDGTQFDRLLDDDDRLELGAMSIKVIHTPGHTPACVVFVIGDAAFVGDTLFMPDFGTARVDFPGGDAVTLYRSIQKIFQLPAETRLFMCHDYKAPGRDEFAWETTVADQRAKNIHVKDDLDQQAFVEFRNKRDAQLGMPKLILPSIQVNIRAGELPPAEDNGKVYMKLPVNVL